MRYFAITLLLLFLVKSTTYGSQPLQVITSENVTQLAELQQIGRGVATALDWHPNGESLAVASASGLWLLDSSLQIIEHTPIQEAVSDVRWSPDGQKIAVIHNQMERCRVGVWDSTFTNRLFTGDLCGNVLGWSFDGHYLAVFSNRSIFDISNLIDIENGNTTMIDGQSGVWSSNSNILYMERFYPYPSILGIWDADEWSLVEVIDVPQETFRLQQILRVLDNRTLMLQCFSVDDNSTGVCEFDIETGEIIKVEYIRNVPEGQCICVSHPKWNDEQTLLVYRVNQPRRGFRSALAVWDYATGENRYLGSGAQFDWKPSTNDVTAIVGNGAIHTYDAQTQTLIAESRLFTAPIHDIALRPQSTQIASTPVGYEQNVNIWDSEVSDMDPVQLLPVEPAQMVSYTSDGQELIAGGAVITDIVVHQNILAFDADTGISNRTVTGYYEQGGALPQRYWTHDYVEYAEIVADGVLLLPNGIQIEISNVFVSAVWSPDETLIATIERYSDDIGFTISTWDVATGEYINQFAGGMFSYIGSEWSADNRQIAVSLEQPVGADLFLRGVRIFGVTSTREYTSDNFDYQVMATVHDNDSLKDVGSVWSKDNDLLAIVLNNTLEIHSLEGEGRQLISLPAYGIADLDWSDDGTRLVGGSQDGRIYVWGVQP